jgi:hypothetical protein
VLGSSDDGRENSSGSIISSKTGLAHTGAVINDKSLNVFVSHDSMNLKVRRKGGVKVG